MILYQGSNVEISTPAICSNKKALDFGSGFYVTSDFDQAKRWAIRTIKARKSGTPIVNCYEFDEKNLNFLDVLYFESTGKTWLEYGCKNRRNEPCSENPDLVIGPVANDQTIRVITDYLNGLYSEEIALQLLLPQTLKDQYTFKTHRGISTLVFKEGIRV